MKGVAVPTPVRYLPALITVPEFRKEVKETPEEAAIATGDKSRDTWKENSNNGTLSAFEQECIIGGR